MFSRCPCVARQLTEGYESDAHGQTGLGYIPLSMACSFAFHNGEAVFVDFWL